MEGVEAREHIELLDKYGLEAQVTGLVRINSDMFVSLFLLLLPENFGVLAVFFQLLLQTL